MIRVIYKVRDLLRQLIRWDSGTDSIVWMREDKHVNDKTSEKTFLLHDRTPDDGYIRGFVVFRQQNAHKMCILLYEIFRQTKTRLQSLAFSEKRKGDEWNGCNKQNSNRKKSQCKISDSDSYAFRSGIYPDVSGFFRAVYAVIYQDGSLRTSGTDRIICYGAALWCDHLPGKNVLHLFITSTGGVGELSNFILGVAFVLPAGLLYKYKKTRTTALIGSIAGAVIMGAFSIVSNYFLVYPVYYNFMPQEAVLGAYQLIAPSMKSILQCLICFNMPFTFIKGMFSVVITFVTYKHISPILKGRQS